MRDLTDLHTRWRQSMRDPFRDELIGCGDDLPARALAWAEPLVDEPAFDPRHVDRLAAEVNLGDVRFEHPLIERSIRVGLAHIMLTFDGDQPRYGTGVYGAIEHAGFPPTIVAVADALSLWGQTSRACRLMGYWLEHFVRGDGAIDYYGPSLSEYGQIVTTILKLQQRDSPDGWLKQHLGPARRLIQYLRSVIRTNGRLALSAGVPEADERALADVYFHNNAWLVRGLLDWSELLDQALHEPDEAKCVREEAYEIRRLLLEQLEATWPACGDDWWLPPTPENCPRPDGGLTGSRLGSYTNYRYWPELMSSGVLPERWMQRLLRARLIGGGQLCGCSRMRLPYMNHFPPESKEYGCLDNWPLADWLEGLARLKAHNELRICVWGHIAYHQAKGHLTAYESVTFPPGRRNTDYCLPSQLVVARAARHLLGR